MVPGKENSVSLPTGPVIYPEMYPVTREELDALASFAPVHPDLVSFWRTYGAGRFNQDRNGRTVEEMVSNRLLDPEEVLALLEHASFDTEDIRAIGLPFFNTLDREFLAIARDGSIVGATPAGEKSKVSGSLQTFILSLTEDPLCYEIRHNS